MSGRCYACNEVMSDLEMTRKYSGTQVYVGLCNHCFSTRSDDLSVEDEANMDALDNNFDMWDELDN